MNKDELSVRSFKNYQTRCIAALSEKYSDFYFELLPEIEPDVDDLKEIESKVLEAQFAESDVNEG